MHYIGSSIGRICIRWYCLYQSDAPDMETHTHTHTQTQTTTRKNNYDRIQIQPGPYMAQTTCWMAQYASWWHLYTAQSVHSLALRKRYTILEHKRLLVSHWL